MDIKIKKLLGTGLSGGYGASNYGKTLRAGFDLDTSDFKDDGGRYHDEWAAHQNGGGQELIETSDGKKWTRVYAGGSLDPESLSKFGITEEAVFEKIKYFLGEMGMESRFDEDKKAEEGDWKYSYKVIKKVTEIPVIVGEEEIRYKGSLVFVHYLINSPVV